MGGKNFLIDSVFRTDVEEQSSIHPLLFAVGISACYIIIFSLYIWISGIYVARISDSVTNLQHFELLKGLMFILFTGLFLFAGIFLILRKLKQRDEHIISQNKSIIASESLVMAGTFSSSVCHDINNLLSIITFNADNLKKSRNLDENDRECLHYIISSSSRLTDLVKRMMEAGRGYIPGEKTREDAALLIRETMEFARIHRKIKTCTLSYEGPEELMLHMNPVLLSRALMNLLLNAAEATGEQGTIIIRLYAGNGAGTMLEVHDNGPGVPAGIRGKIFDHFFTTKKDGNGLGLLSLKICAEQHGGKIEIDWSELGGACFRLILPGKKEGGRIRAAEGAGGQRS